LDFSFLFALYEGASGNPASAADASAYAQQVGINSFPVFADGSYSIASATPMTQAVHPEMCALAPDWTIISCASGHGTYSGLLNDIKAHAGL